MQDALENQQKLRERKFPLARIIVIFSAVVTLVYCALVVDRAFYSYNDSIAQGEKDSKRSLKTALDYVQLTFLSADMAIKRAIDREYFDQLFGRNLVSDIQNNFSIWVNETPQIVGMMMSDEEGRVNAAYHKDEAGKAYSKRWESQSWMKTGISIANDPYFKSHKESNDSELLHINWRKSHMSNHSGFIIFSRRINDINGNFGGVILVVIDNDYIMNFFSSVEIGKATDLLLIKENKTKIINEIKSNDVVNDAYRMMAENDIFTKKIDDKIYVQKMYDDETGELRIFSASKVNGFNLILSTITYEDDILKNWQEQRTNDIIFLSIFALFVMAVSFFAVAVSRQMSKAQKSEKTAILASQAKSDFLANMSHELRTPLNAIIGFSEMLNAGYFGNMTPQQKERIYDVHSCGTHLLSLINDILDFSKGEAGKMELRAAKIVLPKVINETVRMFSEKLHKENIKIEFIKPEKMPNIMADGRKIKQILLNLLSNAVKFTDKEGHIIVKCGFEENKGIFFSVQDNGIGMKEEEIPKALSVFGQVHDKLTHEESTNEGTGLGLPLCKMFTELHGGKLSIESRIGEGTKITVILPENRAIWSHSV